MAIAPSQLAAFMDAHAKLLEAVVVDTSKVDEGREAVVDSANAIVQLSRELMTDQPETARRLNSIALELYRVVISLW